MDTDYVTLPTATGLKEVGFKEQQCDRGFYNGCECRNGQFVNDHDTFCLRPTQAFAKDWFREVHGIHVEPTVVWDTGMKINYQSVVFSTYSERLKVLKDFIENDRQPQYVSHKEALEAGLQQAIAILKNKQNKGGK